MNDTVPIPKKPFLNFITDRKCSIADIKGSISVVIISITKFESNSAYQLNNQASLFLPCIAWLAMKWNRARTETASSKYWSSSIYIGRHLESVAFSQSTFQFGFVCISIFVSNLSGSVNMVACANMSPAALVTNFVGKRKPKHIA